MIGRLGADVVALQEADLRFGGRPAALPRRLIAAETDFEVLPVAESGASLGWHGNAVLLRRGLAASKVTRIDLPGLEPRGAVGFTLDLARPMRVVACHLGLARRYRRRQLDTLARALQPSDRAVILGDFNEWSPRRGFEPLGDDFDVVSPGRSFHAAHPLAALDRIALGRGLALRAAGVETGALARRASDHLPVWADLDVT